MEDDWKVNWEAYLEKRKDAPWNKPQQVNGPIKINLGEIDFYIPPLLGVDAESMKAIQKHNAKKRIF